MKLTGHTPLSALRLGELPQELITLLSGLWVESFEEALSLVAAADAAELDLPLLSRLKATLAPLIVGIPEADLARWMKAPSGRQQLLGHVVDPDDIAHFAAKGHLPIMGRTPFSASEEPLPSSVRLMDQLPPVRHQGERGTCVAFAVTALREFSLDKGEPLSEQYLYWACKMLDGHEDLPGTTIHTAMAALAQHGICRQTTWPYDPKPGVSEHQGPPPDAAKTEARRFTMRNARPVAVNNISHYKRILAGGDGDRGAPVAFAVLVFDSWLRSAATNMTGKITMPLPGEPPLQFGHAMLAVGYQDDASVPGGGYIIARNSWGTEWAANSPEAPGHAMIPYAYMERCALEAFAGEVVVEEEVNETQVVGASNSVQMQTDTPPEVIQLECDMRDMHGKLLRGGTLAIQDPEEPELVLAYTPRNWARFIKNGRRLKD